MLKKIILLIFITSLVYAKDYALSIGIDNGGLTGTSNDAKELKDFLQSRGVRVISLYNKDATKERILTNLQQTIKNMNSGDRLYLFYSGHGTNSFDPFNRNRPKIKEMLQDTGALIPWDIDSSDYARGLIISKRDLVPLFKQLEEKRIETVVMIDACFAGESYKSYSGTNLKNISFFYKQRSKEVVYPYRYITYICASTRSDYTAESSSKHRGYFSIDLIECLKKHKHLNGLRVCMKSSSLPSVVLPKTGDRKIL